MKSDGRRVLRLIFLCGLAMTIISGAAFAQPQGPTATTISERERVLLERIERLERRLNELESRFDAVGVIERSGDVPAPPPQSVNVAPPSAPAQAAAEPQPQPANAASQAAVTPQQNPTPPTTATTSQQPTRATQAPKAAPPPALPPSAAWDKAGVKIIPYGILIANVNYNSSGLVPGSFAGFALPNTQINTNQFNVSPGNTYLGVDIKWPKIGEWEINGKVDFDLRGPTPLRINNVFSPLFINVYGEARTERYRILVGQAPDIISPTFSNSLNLYPAGFLPGRLGFFRPQVRFETYQPISDDFTFTFQGAIAEAIQTFQVGDEVIGDQAGLPDGQMRLALGYGKPDLNDQYKRRPFELGVSGHIGKRRGTQFGRLITQRKFTTWSGDIDLSFKIGGKLRFDGEFFKGSVLGDYTGGVFQTFNPVRLVGIRAAGAWAQFTYDISDKWQVNGGYGWDDPYNRDLASGQRSLNEMGFGNFYYKMTPRLWFATEFSRWKTTWVDLPTGKAFRVESAVLLFF